MSDRYLHDFSEEPTKEEQHHEGTERIASISSYPVKHQELPPLPLWYWRWVVRIWRLFPCMIVGTILAGVIGAIFQFGGDSISGLKRGLLVGALFGCFFDSRFSMNGRMIDD